MKYSGVIFVRKNTHPKVVFRDILKLKYTRTETNQGIGNEHSNVTFVIRN
jgi:hypothetical protein